MHRRAAASLFDRSRDRERTAAVARAPRLDERAQEGLGARLADCDAPRELGPAPRGLGDRLGVRALERRADLNDAPRQRARDDEQAAAEEVEREVQHALHKRGDVRDERVDASAGVARHLGAEEKEAMKNFSLGTLEPVWNWK